MYEKFSKLLESLPTTITTARSVRRQAGIVAVFDLADADDDDDQRRPKESESKSISWTAVRQFVSLDFDFKRSRKEAGAEGSAKGNHWSAEFRAKIWY